MENYEKRYKDALEAIKKLQEANPSDEGIQNWVNDNFPELAMSEDERIRKEIVRFIQMEVEDEIVGNKWLAWLEKKGSIEEIVARCKDSWYNEGKIAGIAEGLTDDEKYQQGWHDALKKQCKRLENYDEYERGRADAIEDTCKWLSQQGDMLEDCFSDINDFVDLYKEAVGGGEKPQGKSALEAIKEEKVDNVNKVKPKFHKGEWIVWQDKCYKVNYNGCGYELVDQNGLITSLEYGTIDENVHHWDITKDAKSGDVLAWDDSKCIAIFKNIYDKDSFEGYGFVGHCTGIFYTRQSYHNIKGAHPATKVQRCHLFQKMKEAGYEWDAEKKEPKKIEQKPTKNIVEIWKDMRLEVYQQASGNKHESNDSDDTTKMFSLNDIDEIFEKIAETYEEKPTDKILQN